MGRRLLFRPRRLARRALAAFCEIPTWRRADDFAASLALRYASQTPEDNF
jgi:alpha-amylase/alpha-mannosidase (GH57 family)